MRTQLILRYESGSLTEDRPAGPGIQLGVGGHREDLHGAIRELSPELDVAPALGVDSEAEASEGRMAMTSAPDRRRSLGMGES